MNLTEQMLAEFQRLPEALQQQALDHVRALNQMQLEAEMDALIAENMEALEELAK